MGMLEVLADGYEQEVVDSLCRVLGPALAGAQQQELTLRELQQVHEQMRQVVSAGKLLHHMDLNTLLTRILEVVLEAVKAQVGAVLTLDDSNALTTRVTWGLREDHIEHMRTSEGERFVDAAFARLERICLSSEQVAAQLDLSELDAQLDGVLVLPLVSGARKYGIIFLANPERAFTDDLQRLGECVRDMAAIALDNNALVEQTLSQQRIEHDIEVARGVQLAMYPDSDLVHKHLTLTGHSRPCDETGGDYYTYIEREGHVYAFIGDVTGHGLGAALYTTMAHAVTQLQLNSGCDIADGASAINTALGYSNQGRFMTAALVDIDVEANTFTYVSAGHNPLLWIHDGEVVWLDSTGMPLGIMPDMPCEKAPETYTLSPGDVLLLYTDGFPEAANPEGVYYEEERLSAMVQEVVNTTHDPHAVKAQMYETIDSWLETNKQADDLTVVVIGVG